MTVFMETTKISVKKTVSEIQEYLASYGAKFILIEYDADGVPIALKFILDYEGIQVPFQLPARVSPVFDYLNEKRIPLCANNSETLSLR